MDDALRDSYDRLATAYADHLWHELDGKPLDRWLLERVAREAVGPVLDVGCGPGHVTAFLAGHGARVSGLDLSPAMIAVARARVPGCEFAVGDLRALPHASGSLGAVVAMYSLVHLPRAEVAAAVAELARVLAPGGLLLAAVHAGDETLHPDALWDIAIDLDWNFVAPELLFDAVAAAGLAPVERLVRWPYDGAEHASRRAYVLARRP
jgi:uncharacterized protein